MHVFKNKHDLNMCLLSLFVVSIDFHLVPKMAMYFFFNLDHA
jgi:hypothetical protein